MARNAMMVHPENIVLAMLGDDEAEVRSRAVRLIQEARGRRQTGEVRRLKCAEIDVSATHYTELTELESYAERADIEPPCTRLLSDADLCALMEQPYQTHVPCHTQSTERAVELTTESAAAVSGADRQDGYSHNKVTYRQRFCQK